MADLASQARSRGLTLVTDILSKTELPAAAPRDAGLSAPLSTDPMGALTQMIRRGLDPKLARAAMEWMAGRTVDLGLMSWDLLAGSLLGPGEEDWLSDLRGHARAVRAVLPEPGAQYTRAAGDDVKQLVADVEAPRFADANEDALLLAVSRRELGALDELRRRGKLDPYREKLLPHWHAWARSLHFAHLPTMATFHLEYLYRALDYRPALADLCEVLLDVGGLDALPEQTELAGGGSVDELELMAYVGIRSAIIAELTDDYAKEIAASPPIDYSGDPDVLAKQTPRAQVAHADAMLRQDQRPVPYEVLTRIISSTGAWRYGMRVLATQAAARFPTTDEPLRVLDTFLTNYGNEYRVWYQMNSYAPEDTNWITGLHERLVRELSELPHDVSVWAAMAVMLTPADPDPPLADVNGRAEQQCHLD